MAQLSRYWPVQPSTQPRQHQPHGTSRCYLEHVWRVVQLRLHAGPHFMSTVPEFCMNHISSLGVAVANSWLAGICQLA